jgi:hypothetical protein
MSTVAAAEPVAADLVMAAESVPALVPARMLNDRVMVINLGCVGDSSQFLLLGHHERLPTSAAVVV